MTDIQFDIALKNTGSQVEGLSLFSAVESGSQKASKYSFSTPYAATYPSGAVFTLTDSFGSVSITLVAESTMSEVINLLNALNAGTWIVGYNDAINGNVFHLLSIRNPETLAIDNVIYYGTWSLVDTGGTFAFFMPISFPDSISIIASSSVGVERSNDNGNTFTNIALPSSVIAYQSSFIDGNNGFLVGNNGAPGRVWNTNDNGQSWFLVSSPAYNLYGLYMLDALNGFAYGENISIPGQYEVLQTADGGATWVSLQIIGTAMGFIKFVDALNGFILQAGGVTDLIVTIDGGVTWNALPLGFTANYFFALNANDVWAVGNAGIVRYSSNGGGTWNNWDIVTANAALFVHAFNTSHVVVAVTNNMYRTIDGGLTWDAPQVIAAAAFLKAFNFRDQFVGIAVINTNNIYKYS